MKKQLLSILLCCIMLAGLLPTTAFAAGTGKAIQLGTGSITGYADTNSYDYIYFGNWKAPDGNTASGPIKWRVLDDQTNTGETGLFLLSDGLFGSGDRGNVNFDSRRNDTNNKWPFSSAQTWCQDFAGVAGAESNVPDAFTNGELTAILATTKSDAEYNSEAGLFYASEKILDGEKVFFLSAEEAEKAGYGFADKNARKANYGGSPGCWWLRSPYVYRDTFFNTQNLEDYAGGIHRLGDTAFRFVNVLASSIGASDGIWAARPAFNLDSSAILFTSAAEGGKSASGMDSGLTAVGDYNGSEWKLTLKDSSRSGFSAKLKFQTDLTAVVSYSGAAVGENESISAMVTNGNAVKYYGRISAVSQASGTVTVTLPEDFNAADGDKLSIFNEQYNGDKQTDYASNQVEIEVSTAAPHEHSWAAAWTYDDTSHWHACTVAGCNVISENEAHTWGDNGLCTKCGRSKGHAHCVCGGSVTAGDHKSHTEQIFLPWSGGDVAYQNGVTYVYLEQNITLNSNLEVAGGNTLYLCLHGNTISSNGTNKIVVKENSRLVICDCSGGGVIKGATKGWGGTGIYLYQSTLDFFGGKITGGKVAGNGGGGAIALDDKNCVLNIYGGEISGNNGKNSGGAIFLKAGGTVNLYGGKICNNTATNGGAIYAGSGGTINLIGGELSGNTSSKDGGAVYAGNGALMKIAGTKLTENTATQYGGAIYLNQNSTLVMNSGELSKNRAVEGGAVFIYYTNSTFTLVNGSITGNSATDGGAVYLNQDDSIFNMGGGTISGNTATQNGGAVYANRAVSVMNMSGGTIETNTAGKNGGAVYLDRGQLKLTDTPVVKNNTVSGKANNVYLKNGTMLTAYYFKPTEKIGVTTETLPTEGNPVVFCESSDHDYSGYFFSDDANAHVEYNSNEELQLAVGAASAHTHVWATEWSSDGAHHWHECTAGSCDITDNAQKDGYAAHSGEDDGDCTTAVTCECSYEITAAKAEHSYPDTWTAVRPGTTHNRKCQNAGCAVTMAENCVSDGKATCQNFAKCTICGGECGTKADHIFTAEAVDAKYLKSAATCTAKAVYYKSCSVCGAEGTETFEIGEFDASNHAGSLGNWQASADKHWKEYSCCHVKAEEAAHVYDDDADTICNICQYERGGASITYTVTFDANGGSGTMDDVTVTSSSYTLPECTFTAPQGQRFKGWTNTDDGEVISDTVISVTGNTTLYAIWENIPQHVHVFDQEVSGENTLKTPADCTQDGVYYKSCTCGAVSDTETFTAPGTALGHAWPEHWSKDETNHWYECGRCHEKKDEAPHDFGDDDICDTCGYDKSVSHTHHLTLVSEKAATCTEDGNQAYYTCDGCDKWFADENGTAEITDKTSVTIKANGHTPSNWKSDETDHWKECTVSGCGTIINGSKAAHIAGDWIIDKPATGTAVGSKHKECTVCSRTLETAEIPKTEHTHTYSNWKSDETSHWKECTDCGKVIDGSKAAHIAGDWIIDKPATETAVGSKHKECTVCGRTLETLEIPKTEHTHTYGDWKSDETCHWKECTISGCTNKTQAEKHTFQWVVDKEATATKNGSKHEECTACGYKKAAVDIPATGSATQPTNPTKPAEGKSTTFPKTGDSSNIFLWIALLLVSGGAVIGVILYGKKRKDNDE